MLSFSGFEEVDDGLGEAGFHGSMEAVLWFVRCGADHWQWLAERAIMGEQMEVLEWIFGEPRPAIYFDPRQALRCAVHYDKYDFAIYLMGKVAVDRHILHVLVDEACMYGSLHAFKALLERGGMDREILECGLSHLNGNPEDDQIRNLIMETLSEQFSGDA